VPSDDDVANFSDIDDSEISCYILSEKDVQTKKRLWLHFNKDYLKEKEEKDRLKELQGDKGKPVRKYRKGQPASSAKEAAQQVLLKKLPKKSSLINWEAYNTLFKKLEGGGGFEGEGTERGEEEKGEIEQEAGGTFAVEGDEHLQFSSEEEVEDGDDPLGFL